jgi:hypothetical protein
LSRLPSSRGSSAASPSGRSSTVAGSGRRPGVLVQSPKSDIFVVMLGIALGAIVLGCLLMLIMFSRYSFSTKVSTLSQPSQVTAIA